MTFLFMGVQEDPELEVIAARGIAKIYDGGKYGTSRDGEPLPPGETCGSCAYFAKCDWLVATPPDSVRCDWAPSRFKEVSS
jgi:hypothetical protein